MSDSIADLIERAKAQMASFRLEKKPAYQKKPIDEEQYAFYQIMHGGTNLRVYPRIHLWMPTPYELQDAIGPDGKPALWEEWGQESATVAVHGHLHTTACGTLYMCHMAFYRYTGKRQADWHRRWDYLYV
jgi:hypothetical protein